MPDMIVSFPPYGITGEDEKHVKVYWKIMFEVQFRPSEEGECVPTPLLQKEVTVWSDPQTTGPRINCGKAIINLTIDKTENVTYKYDDDLGRCKAVFENGYLKCTDINLRTTVEAIVKGTVQLEHTSSPNNLGDNIRIQVDFNSVGERDQNVYSPFFYYPQPNSHFINFAEEFDSQQDGMIHWRIAHASGPLNLRSSKKFKKPPGWYQLMVRQDHDEQQLGQPIKPYYEFRVDGVSLDRQPFTSENIKIGFDSDTTFYIGRGDSEESTLTGEISRLEFDPNDTCWGC